MSYRNYVPWARKEIENSLKEGDKSAAAAASAANTLAPSDKESPPDVSASDDKTESNKTNSTKDYGSRRYGSSGASRSSDLSSYRASNYIPSTPIAPPLSRERSISRDAFSSTLTVPTENTYSRPSFGRSASTLTEKDLTATAAKKDYSSYSKYSSGSPHKTVSYAKYEDKSPSRTDSTAFSKYNTSSSPFSTSRFLKKEQTSTEKLENFGIPDGRYHYRTRPQPVLKKLDIPTSSSTSRPESSANLTPTSPTASKTFLPEKPNTAQGSIAPEYPNVTKYINITTRATSPTPPSTYYRSRRSEIAREIIKDIQKPPKVDSKDKETQTEQKTDETAVSRYSRYSRTSTPWTSALVEKYASPSSAYSSSISRYMSKLNSDPPKSTIASRYSRFDNDSGRSSLTEKKESAGPVIATIRQTAAPQSVSYSSDRKQRSPSKERVPFSPRPARRLSNVSIERDLPSKTASTYTPSTRSSVKSRSPVQDKITSSPSSISKRKSPEKKTILSPQQRLSKSPEKTSTRVHSPEKQTVLRKSPLKQNSKSPEKVLNVTDKRSILIDKDASEQTKLKKSPTPDSTNGEKIIYASPKFVRKTISPEKLPFKRVSHSPEKQVLRRKSVSKTPEPLVTQKPPISKSPSPEKRINTTPEKTKVIKTNSFGSVSKSDSSSSIRQRSKKSPEKSAIICKTKSNASIKSSASTERDLCNENHSILKEKSSTLPNTESYSSNKSSDVSEQDSSINHHTKTSPENSRSTNSSLPDECLYRSEQTAGKLIELNISPEISQKISKTSSNTSVKSLVSADQTSERVQTKYTSPEIVDRISKTSSNTSIKSLTASEHISSGEKQEILLKQSNFNSSSENLNNNLEASNHDSSKEQISITKYNKPLKSLSTSEDNLTDTQDILFKETLSNAKKTGSIESMMTETGEFELLDAVSKKDCETPEAAKKPKKKTISRRNSAKSSDNANSTDSKIRSTKKKSKKIGTTTVTTSKTELDSPISDQQGTNNDRESSIEKEQASCSLTLDSAAYDNSESNIVIENLKSVLEELKTGLLRDHVIETPIQGENYGQSVDKLCEPTTIEQNNNFLPVMIEEQNKFSLDCFDDKQLTIELSPSPLGLSPPTNKKPPLSPSKSDAKLNDARAKVSSTVAKHLKPSSSLNALVKPKNKDFRKSPLNMNSNLVDDSERALSEGCSPKDKRKVIKSRSVVSRCENSSSGASLHDNELLTLKKLNCFTGSQQSINMGDSPSLSLSSKLDQAGGSTNDMSIDSSSPHLLSDYKIERMNEGSRPESRTKFVRHSRSSRHDSSSTDSSSEESESEESEDKEQNNGISKMVQGSFDSPQESPVLPLRSRSISQLMVISRDASGTSDDPSISLPLDKPPLPPNVKSKEDSPNKAASYLMRALAPVTNLFFSKSKEDKSITSECDRMDTSQSLSELPLDKSDDHLDSESIGLFSEEITEAPQLRDERYNTLPVRQRPASQDIDWWLDENERKTAAEMKDVICSAESMPIAEADTTRLSSENVDMSDIKPTSIAEEESKKSLCKSSDLSDIKPTEIRSRRVGHGAKKKIRPFSSGDNPLTTSNGNNHRESLQSPQQCSEPGMDTVKRKIFRSSSGINTLSWCLDITGDLSESEESESESESESSEETEEDSKPAEILLGTKQITIKKIESGEMAWWQKSSTNVPEGISRIESKTSVSDHACPQNTETTPWWLVSESDKVTKECSASMESEEPVAQVYRIRTQQSGDKARWLQSTENVPLSLQVSGSSSSIRKSGSGRRKYKIRHAESGEKAWWMQSNDNIPDGIKTPSIASNRSVQRNASLRSVSGRDIADDQCQIQRIDSGDNARWLLSPDNVSEGIVRTESRTSSKGLMRNESGRSVTLSDKKSRIRHVDSGETAWWMNSSENFSAGIKRTESLRSHTGSNTGSLKRNESSKSIQRNLLLKTESGEISSIDNASEGVRRSESIRSRLKNLSRIESGERAWWMEDSGDNVPEGITALPPDETIEEQDDSEEESDEEDAEEVFIDTEPEKKTRWLRPAESGEMAWWMSKDADVPAGVTQLTPSESEESESEETESESGESPADQPMIPKFPLVLGDRTSPDGLEMPSLAGRRFTLGGRESPYENVEWMGEKMFIGDTTNIDDLLGDIDPLVLPAADDESKVVELPLKKLEEVAKELKDSSSSEEESSDESDKESESKESKSADILAKTESVSESEKDKVQDDVEPGTSSSISKAQEEPTDTSKLDDAALQILKDGEYGAYLDLDASISEQHEEFDGFELNRKNSIVLRTQLSVRVHTIIEKLLNSEGRELRRALFSLKQIFQEDKDLVHEFVQNDGLACLIKVGSEVDQNYQNYILRALGQVMLYVDGMNGIMAHGETVQWLYSLIASKFRLVLKTALKLLLVFVEYKESNCSLLVSAIRTVDIPCGEKPWYNVMRLLGGYDTSDTELLVYACTLLNKTLNGLSDLDTYYDQVDAIEEQGMKDIVQQYMTKQGTDLDLLRQLQIYEAVLHHEDGVENTGGTPLRQLDETIRKTLRSRKVSGVDSPKERRKSRRCLNNRRGLNSHSGPQLIVSPLSTNGEDEDDEEESSSSRSPSPSLGGTIEFIVGCGYENYKSAGNHDVTPALKKRRERAERQRSLREQQETILRSLNKQQEADADNVLLKNSQSGELDKWQQNNNQVSRTSSRQDMLMNAVNMIESECENQKEGILQQLSRENTVKDLTQKLSNQTIVLSPSDEKVARLGDMSGLISKAMEGLTKSKSKSDLKPETKAPPPEPKKSETDLQWETIMASMDRPLELCDLDFTDLNSDDEENILAPSALSSGIPPPPPPISLSQLGGAPPPPPAAFAGRPPAPPASFGRQLNDSDNSELAASQEKLAKKSKKTVKLFWKEVRDDAAIMARLQKTGLSLIWDELSPVSVDTQKLEHLFESRAKEIVPKKQQDMIKSKEIIVLDPKRSNAINIGMTKLPPPGSIKSAILKMDATVMNREGIEKLFTMLPTEEEKAKILEAQVAHPDIPLGSAEQFLMTLGSITELPARLKLWAFKLDYENIEKEIVEPVMDLKQGMEILKANKTFRCILGTLLSIGIFLNGSEVRGFQIEYLAKVPEVKDTVHKHSLLHHLCHMVMEKFTEATDLYSEIGSITRASKVDFDELEKNMNRLETECKASWDHLKVIAKHDGSSAMKNKMSEFLTDCAQRIMVLSTVHRRVMNRYVKFLLWLGTPPSRIQDTKPNEFCRILSEFALEYRTTRERVLQQMEKKATHRERNKTRGKMITEQMPKFRSKEEQNQDDQLRQLLGGGEFTDSEKSAPCTWRRQRRDLGRMHSEVLPKKGDNADDDEILESLVKTATKSPATRTTPRERKRTRHADRKSLRRTLRNGLSDEERKHLAALIKGY